MAGIIFEGLSGGLMFLPVIRTAAGKAAIT
jgi:hypothetical protein